MLLNNPTEEGKANVSAEDYEDAASRNERRLLINTPVSPAGRGFTLNTLILCILHQFSLPSRFIPNLIFQP